MLPTNSINDALTLLLVDNMTRFPTDEDCLQELLKYIEIKCNHCKSDRIETWYGRRDGRCLKCNRKTWLTAGTFFTAVKRPRAYLMAIIIMGNGIVISGAEFARLLSIVTSSAQQIIKKISSVLVQLMEQVCPGADSVQFSDCVIRRSKRSPAGEHPRSEFECVQRQLTAQANEEQLIVNTLGDDEKTVYKHFTDKPMSYSELELASGLKASQLMTALTMLEIASLIKRDSGINYVKLKIVAKPVVIKTNKKLERFIKRTSKLIRKSYKGVSRKYLQLYLAACWCILDRKNWNVTSLLKACSNSKAISRQDLADYVSPSVVLVCPIA